MQPLFLTLEQALVLHEDQIARHGGDPSLRDRGLLESALAMPMAQFGGAFLHPDLFEMAAAYLFHIVMNHPFVDGNKRAGAVAAIVFLDMNDCGVAATNTALAEMVLSVAKGEMRKPEIAEWFRRHGAPAQARSRRPEGRGTKRGRS